MTAKHKSHKVFGIITLVILLLALTGIIIWLRFRPAAKADNSEQKNNVIALQKQTLTESISATGTIDSANTKTVSANVNNLTVQKVHVNVGDQVTKGDTLVTFDESDLEDALSDAQTNLTSARADADRSISSAKQQLSDARETSQADTTKSAKSVSDTKQALSKAKKQVQSLKKSLKAAKDAASKKELQEQLSKAEEAQAQAQTAYDNAVSNRDSTARQNKSNIQNAKNAVDNAQASADKTIREAKKQVTEAQKNLKNCTVTAPISGTVTAVNIADGDNYSGGDLLQIEDTSAFIVKTSVDEYDISKVSVGQQAVILTEATNQTEIQGEISFVAPSTSATSSVGSSGSSSTAGAGSGSNTTGSSSSDGYEVVITVRDNDERLKIGLTARCSLILQEASDVFAVPYDAVHKAKGGDTVIYVAADETHTDEYEEIPVTQGMESDYYVEIQSDQLKEGMLVVIPTDETEDASTSTEETSKGFDFSGGPGMSGDDRKMQDGNRHSGNSDFKGNGGGNPPGNN